MYVVERCLLAPDRILECGCKLLMRLGLILPYISGLTRIAREEVSFYLCAVQFISLWRQIRFVLATTWRRCPWNYLSTKTFRKMKTFFLIFYSHENWFLTFIQIEGCWTVLTLERSKALVDYQLDLPNGFILYTYMLMILLGGKNDEVSSPSFW